MPEEIILHACRPSSAPDAARGYWLPRVGTGGKTVPPAYRAAHEARIHAEMERVEREEPEEGRPFDKCNVCGRPLRGAAEFDVGMCSECAYGWQE